jgi:hypothetical protein
MKSASASVSVFLLLVVGGCDPSARSEARGGGLPSGDSRSREHESCGRTADCANDLRCFDGVCRSGELSVLGELHGAAGDRAMADGRAAEAADAFGAAAAQYEKDKLPVPARFLCAHGRALSKERGAGRAELAARLLHRCLLGAPAGSSLHAGALAGLAALLDSGLDPAVVARPQPADAYLTRTPPAPPVESLELEVSVQSRSRASTFKRFSVFLKDSPEVKAALATCWSQNWERTRSDRLELTIPFRYGFSLDLYEDFAGAWIKVADAEAATDPDVAEATACARAALEPLAEAEGKKMNDESRWDAAATFLMAPGS